MRRLALLAAALLTASPALAQDEVFDLHVHLHDGEDSLRAYEAQIAEAGLTVTGLGAMWFGGPNQALAGNDATIRAGNDALIALAAHNASVLPIATVHPYDGVEAIAELERVAALGVRVLKIHPHTQKFDAADERVNALVRRAGELGVVMLLDNAGIVPDDHVTLFNLALAHPRTKFVFAHMGGLGFRFWNILALARTADGLFADNVYFDISATVVIAAGSPIEDELLWTMRNVGTDRLLLGSDYPQLTLPATLAALDRLPLTDEERAAIRYGTARELFGLPQ
jgi:predicted TIM-barrel fold metal-dependent hydrolase